MSEPGSFYSFNGDNADGYMPLPSVIINNTPTLILGDATLYNLASFIEKIFNNNLNPRFSQDMFNAGVKNRGLPSYRDGYAIAEVVYYKLHPQILTTTGFLFPLLSIV